MIFKRFIYLITSIFYLSLDFILCQKVKLIDVQTLTLTSGYMTTGRRSASVPQLKCIGGKAGCGYTPHTVQCYNKGSDGVDVQWECKGELETNLKFGQLRVSCEGYNYSDDPYILTGSCGLEYTLEYKSDAYYNPYTGKNYLKASKIENFLTLLVVVIIAFAVYKTCNKSNNNETMYTSVNNDHMRPEQTFDYPTGPAPPPYGFRADINDENTASSHQQQQNTNPLGGFWTGAAVGGLGGYFLGKSTSSDSTRFVNRSGYTTPPPAYDSSDDTKTSTGFATTTRR